MTENTKYCQRCDEPVPDRVPACPLQCRSPGCKAYQQKARHDVSQKPIVWVLGGPGSGKGTQCQKIVAKYGFTHLSTGDLLHDEIVRGSDRAKCIMSVMQRGELAPNDLVLNLLKEAIERCAPTSKGFLIDGYPREKSQGLAFEDTIASPNVIIFFAASPGTLLKRLLNRALNSERRDDNEATFKLSLQNFDRNNDMVLQQYRKKVITINAEPPVDAIFTEVQKIFDPLMQSTATAAAAATAAAENKT